MHGVQHARLNAMPHQLLASKRGRGHCAQWGGGMQCVRGGHAFHKWVPWMRTSKCSSMQAGACCHAFQAIPALL